MKLLDYGFIFIRDFMIIAPMIILGTVILKTLQLGICGDSLFNDSVSMNPFTLTIKALKSLLFIETREERKPNRSSYIMTNNSATANNFKSSIKQTEPIIQKNVPGAVTMAYQAPDNGTGDNEYIFEYLKKDGVWKAYIKNMPSLRGRSQTLFNTHRLSDSNGYYVCWDESVFNLDEIKSISQLWADCMQEYIATGQRFG